MWTYILSRCVQSLAQMVHGKLYHIAYMCTCVQYAYQTQNDDAYKMAFSLSLIKLIFRIFCWSRRSPGQNYRIIKHLHIGYLLQDIFPISLQLTLPCLLQAWRFPIVCVFTCMHHSDKAQHSQFWILGKWCKTFNKHMRILYQIYPMSFALHVYHVRFWENILFCLSSRNI